MHFAAWVRHRGGRTAAANGLRCSSGADRRAPSGDEQAMPHQRFQHPQPAGAPARPVLHVPAAAVLRPSPTHAAGEASHARARLVAEVLGVILLIEFTTKVVVSVVGDLFQGGGWAPAIGAESIYLITCLLLVPLLPTGVRHVISWRTTWDGIRLDWPEVVYASYVLWAVLSMGSLPNGLLAPLTMALAIGAAEEFVFRVLFLGWLVSRMDAAPAVLISAIVFGMAHMHEYTLLGLMSVVPQFAGGMVLGAVYLRTRNPIGPILVHAYWDLPYLLLLGAGISGGSTEGGMPSVVSLLPWIAAGLYGLWLVRHGVDAAGREREPEATAIGFGGSRAGDLSYPR